MHEVSVTDTAGKQGDGRKQGLREEMSLKASDP